MKHTILIGMSCAALALAGCGKSEDKTAATNTADVTANGSGVDLVISPDQAFVNAVASDDAFIIQSSQLVVSKGHSGAIRRYADAMIKAHSETAAKLPAAAASAVPAITPQLALSDAQKQQLDTITGLSGAAFEGAYKQAQVDVHQNSLNSLKAYSQSGGQASLKSFATATIPTVTAHLNMAKGL